jgi:hypothetical protein
MSTTLESITKRGTLDMQVCVPSEWTDEQVKSFAERENPCGTTHGWQIRREGDEALVGSKERVQCASISTNVHIMLDA